MLSVNQYAHFPLEMENISTLPAMSSCKGSWFLAFFVCHAGFEQFSQWRSDRTLVFHFKVGDQPPMAKKSEKMKQTCTPVKVKLDPSDYDFDDDEDEDEEMELAVDDDDSGAESSQSSLLSTPKTVTRRLASLPCKCDCAYMNLNSSCYLQSALYIQLTYLNEPPKKDSGVSCLQ